RPGPDCQPAHPASRVRLRPSRGRSVREGAMNEARPFASLSSGLLARQGAARLAMRPQGFGPHNGFEDLGWNDLDGPDPVEDLDADLPEHHVPSSISALTPAPKSAQPA